MDSNRYSSCWVWRHAVGLGCTACLLSDISTVAHPLLEAIGVCPYMQYAAKYQHTRPKGLDSVSICCDLRLVFNVQNIDSGFGFPSPPQGVRRLSSERRAKKATKNTTARAGWTYRQNPSVFGWDAAGEGRGSTTKCSYDWSHTHFLCQLCPRLAIGVLKQHLGSTASRSDHSQFSFAGL